MGCLSFYVMKSYFYFLIYWLLDLSIVIVRDLYLMEEIKDPKYMQGTEFIYVSCLNIADLFAGFLVLSTYRKMKTIEYKEIEKKKIQEKSDHEIELIYNDLSIREHKMTYLFIISILEFMARCTDLFYLLFFGLLPIRIGQVNWLISIDTFARIIISRVILKTKLYKHHFSSIIVITIGLSVMSICAFAALSDQESLSWPYFIFVAVKYILLPLEDVFNKILLTDQFMLPHYIMFWRGIFDFIFLIILSAATVLPSFIQFNYFTQFETKLALLNQVLMKVLFTIFSFFKSFCLLKILDAFSPQHVAFCNTAFSLYQCIKCRTKSKDNKILMAVDAIFLVVIILATLVFNEVIIINAFGLNTNTRKGMLKKEKQEFQSIEDGVNDDSGDEDDDEKKEKMLNPKDENSNEKDNNGINRSVASIDNNTS